MNEKVTITRTPDESPLDVRSFALDEAKRRPPLLAWAEPDPSSMGDGGRAGRRRDFHALVRGVPAWPKDLRIVEARLFWEKSALCILSTEGSGCRWVKLEEGTGAAAQTSPSGEADANAVELEEATAQTSPRGQADANAVELREAAVAAAQDTEDVLRDEFPVLSLQDWNRFGFSKPPFEGEITAIVYRKKGRLVAWRLWCPGADGGNA